MESDEKDKTGEAKAEEKSDKADVPPKKKVEEKRKDSSRGHGDQVKGGGDGPSSGYKKDSYDRDKKDRDRKDGGYDRSERDKSDRYKSDRDRKDSGYNRRDRDRRDKDRKDSGYDRDRRDRDRKDSGYDRDRSDKDRRDRDRKDSGYDRDKSDKDRRDRDRKDSGYDRDRKDSSYGRRGKLDSERKEPEKKSTSSSSHSYSKSREVKQQPAPPPKLTEQEKKALKEAEEKKKQEEEERKLEEAKQKEEEERLKKEEEEKRKAEEEAQRLKEEQDNLNEFIEETRARLEFKDSLKENNVKAAENRPEESFFSKLDSSLKKNTAFVKKLRNLIDSQKDALIKDFNGLNLSKYIGECASALADTKLKMSDVNCAVHLSSLIHQRYADFSTMLKDNFQKVLLSKKDEKISNASKYRVDLRLFAELLSVEVISFKEGLPILANQLSYLINNDKEEHNHLSIISSFCKHCGDDYAGLIPRKYRLLAEKYGKEIPRSRMLPPKRQGPCRNLLKDYYTSLCNHLTKDHKKLKTMEKQNRRMLITKGEVSTERREVYEAAHGAYQKLYTATATFVDLLDEDMPDLPEEEIKLDGDESFFDIFSATGGEFQLEGDITLFEDEDTRTFYETLPDLKAFIPGILYKDSENSQAAETNVKDIDSTLELEIDVEDLEKEIESEISLVDEALDTDGKETEDGTFLPPEAEDGDTETGSLMKSQFETFLQSLPNCVNRDHIDKAAIEFCMNFNTKFNRKKLVRALFTVHRTRYDLLPFYSRLVAILNPCMPDLATDLIQYLKGDFKWHVCKKDQINIESKLKTVRFIGEMVKFKMCPKVEALHCMKKLMFDFRHHNIEMACSLLESCGRFLYRSPDSHHRTRVYLDVMMRKKSALHLDPRYITMIENAYFYSNPPEAQQIVRVERPPIHQYIRKLLYKDLTKITTEKVLRQIRKLDWDDPDIAFYATKCLTGVWNTRYNSIHCMANLIAGLAPYHEHVAIQVVDGVLEDVRLGMEINHPRYNQRRVSSVKYLGELYNYRMVESGVIFKTLYTFITFGVSMNEKELSTLDAPDHLFRIRLTCVLLETCGQYFDKGSSKKKLDCFLIYFLRYYWYKRSQSIWTNDHPFPIDIGNLVHDTMDAIRPKLKQPKNQEEAFKAAEELDNEYKSKISSLLIVETGDEDEENIEDDEDGLATINEADEAVDELSEDLSQVYVDELATGESEPSQDDRSQSQQDACTSSQNIEECSDSQGDDMMESAGEEADDEVTLLSGGPKYVQCQEDEDFLSAFDKMMSENLKSRTREAVKVPQMDIIVPMYLKDKRKKTGNPNPNPFADPPPDDVVEEEENTKSLNFLLMTRKGNKQQFTNLKVPASADFVSKFREREKEALEEKEEMKQVVLGIHERQEEEDWQDMIATMNKNITGNVNRERKVRYNHPKGAPDADLIFGSK
ncbi:hypothetical protein SNE40_014951 [Patella caerulea]|uniref:Regulator of nonsense transcripts 2 n=1 Tax=Patella caerulea TaxID=87958 RepID=A0AAN8JFN3_PATCE